MEENKIYRAKGTLGFKNDIKLNDQLFIIRFSSTKTGEVLGELKEKDGLLTFEGKVDESGKLFVDYICELFKQRQEDGMGSSR